MDKKALAAAVGKELSAIDHKLMALLGMALVAIEPGRAVVKMLVRDDMVNSHNYCQGGLLFTLADHAFAYACMSENQAGVTLSAHVIFTNPARLGDVVTAVAEVQTTGKRIASCNVLLTNQDDLPLVQYQGVNYRTRQPVIT